jgi:methanogenic corrinoid protein MtbC1
VQHCHRILESHFDAAGKADGGTVVLCTARGDVHGIGKNIVAAITDEYAVSIGADGFSGDGRSAPDLVEPLIPKT